MRVVEKQVIKCINHFNITHNKLFTILYHMHSLTKLVTFPTFQFPISGLQSDFGSNKNVMSTIFDVSQLSIGLLVEMINDIIIF
jgi:hypothetical protein